MLLLLKDPHPIFTTSFSVISVTEIISSLVPFISGFSFCWHSIDKNEAAKIVTHTWEQRVCFQRMQLIEKEQTKLILIRSFF